MVKRAPTKKGRHKTEAKVSSTKATRATQKSPITRGTKSRVCTPSTSPTTSTDDEGICEKCGGSFKDDDKSTRRCWMAFDTCDRWFHCHYIGLHVVPKGHWSCKYC